MSATSPHIIDATPETFEREVIERSKEVPVVVDFWAEWCQPCKMLGPVLERLAEEAAGAFVLVKANTEKLQDFAMAFGVRSIPAVFAIKNGQVVDGFVGVVPEAQIRDMLDRLKPTEAETLLAEAKALAPTDPAGAEERFRKAIELDHTAPAPKVAFASFLLDQGRPADCLEQVHDLERRAYTDAEVERLRAAAELALDTQESGGLDAARAAAEANPADASLRLKLAEALAASRKFEDALQIGLELVESGPKDQREPARHLMLNVFNLLPPDSPLSADYRRRLASALY